MEVKVCKNCRKLFNYSYGPEMCPDCLKLVEQERLTGGNPEASQAKAEGGRLLSGLRSVIKEDEEKYNQVRDYIMSHPSATVTQIAEANGVTPMKLLDWIKDDRLEFSDDSKYAWFTCEKCGAKIRSGRLCNRCKISK